MDMQLTPLQKVGTSIDNQVILSLISLNQPQLGGNYWTYNINFTPNYYSSTYTTEFSAKSGYFYRQLGTFELNYP